MATYDSSDLLAKFKLYARFPTLGTAPLTDVQAYSLLSDGQQEAVVEMASQIPWAMLGAPTLLTSSDGGVTYPFGTDGDGNAITPLAVEVYAQLAGRELYAASYGALGGDFVIERQRLRMPGNRAQTFTAGPYARFVTVPLKMDASTAPALQPLEARPLIALAAARKFARLGGLIDETPFQLEYDDLWLGKVQPGGYRAGGLRDALKLQYRTRMGVAVEGAGGKVWWQSFLGPQ